MGIFLPIPIWPSVLIGQLVKSLMRIDVDAKLGVPTDIIDTRFDADQPAENKFIVGTSKGYILRYVIYASSNAALCEQQWRPGKGSIRKICLLSPTILLVANTSGKIRILELDENKTPNSFLLKCSLELGVVSSLAVSEADKNVLYLGNDEGDIHICRIALKEGELSVLKSFDHHDDYISSLLHVAAKKTLLATSGDGSLAVIDLKKNKVKATSKNFEADVTALATIPSAAKVFVGLGSGEIKVLKWNYWGAPCDSLKARFHNHASINDMLLIEGRGSTQVLISASDDGVIRLMPAMPLSASVEVTQINDSVERLAWIPETIDKEILGELGTLAAIPAGEAAIYLYRITQELVNSLLARINSSTDTGGSSSKTDEEEEEDEEDEEEEEKQEKEEEDKSPNTSLKKPSEENDDDQRYSSVAARKHKRATTSSGLRARSFLEDLD